MRDFPYSSQESLVRVAEHYIYSWNFTLMYIQSS